MRGIFISYRREDTEGQAGRLFASLAARFGKNAVFMDVAAIEPGRDFRRAIEEHVSSCGVVLVLIGKDWVDARNQKGERRLDDPNDFVRLETAAALKRDIPVVPVLLKGAGMPTAGQLPKDLQELAYRNAVELTHTRWESDAEVLITALLPYVQTGSGDGTRKIWVTSAVALTIVGTAAVVIFFWQADRTNKDKPARTTSIVSKADSAAALSATPRVEVGPSITVSACTRPQGVGYNPPSTVLIPHSKPDPFDLSDGGNIAFSRGGKIWAYGCQEFRPAHAISATPETPQNHRVSIAMCDNPQTLAYGNHPVYGYVLLSDGGTPFMQACTQINEREVLAASSGCSTTIDAVACGGQRGINLFNRAFLPGVPMQSAGTQYGVLCETMQVKKICLRNQ